MRARQPDQSTLFPFVSVLICIIGTLSFLIIATGITSSVGASRDFVRAGDPILEDMERARIEQQNVDTRRAIWRDQVAGAEARLRDAENELERLRAATEMLSASREQVAFREGRLRELQRERVAVERQLDAIRRAQGSTKVRISEGSEYKPIFVECNEDGCVVLANGRAIPTEEIESSNYVKGLLRNIDGSPSWCLYLLVRPGGVHAFDNLYYLARASVPIGFHPIQAGLVLDVSDWPQPPWL